MLHAPLPDMTAALHLTRAGRLHEATRLLQGRLSTGNAPPAANTDGFHVPFSESAKEWPKSWADAPSFGNLFQGQRGFNLPEMDFIEPASAPMRDVTPTKGRFLSKSYRNAAGTRAYKLYVPSGYKPARPLPLIVMLHGCTQSPDDFAAGTRMNLLADDEPALIAYPAQSQAANSSKCWNWFNPGDQQADKGEPSLIAGITRQVMQDYAVDPGQVYVAGLSAGGAAAAILGQAYPDLYAAVGVHSGLACGAACDLASALSAMQQGGAVKAGNAMVPTIVFHGDRDSTVHPKNGDQVLAQSQQAASGWRSETERGQTPGGRSYTRTRHRNRQGRSVHEQWMIHGAGHAWAGGSPAGSYTDPKGPDASREMRRFFREQARPGGQG